MYFDNVTLAEEFDLVEQIDDDSGDYTWSCVGIFRRKSDGELFWSSDRGCSCSGPWECFTVADLDPLRGNEQDFINACSEISKRGHEQAQQALSELR